ncbi:hypothetical protein BX661DRAFT_187577 [Kickxella alabastrina]|uniref:uncharacterized protein n=1 Tax=Kickxella alabastrina TaxID=61397 RepID=UPI0022205541|nr:uncharacterized protein BX661DRAFT_187577 [Kickxella alabastrina]KAI7822258.1 hypothetical protein BX661DRAFT_187577 [Kickxella alabastrina]KAJ1947339.1 hypothetical protein GGF37_000521 [Kickxella alabastrina]
MSAEHKNVVVAVRCRPLNSREIKRGASCLVSMGGQQTVLDKPEALHNINSNISSKPVDKTRRTYNFDYSYWTAGDINDSRYASQEVVFNDIGHSVLEHALSGYHCCVFAYGQTGSGKSYTMMGGSGKEAGLIPRICEQLFARVARGTPDASYRIEVSYLEIYNERVRDLLNPQGASNLRVREHPSLGPYVEDLTKAAVDSYSAVFEHMSQGNKARTVAATSMNEVSSRSHAVFTIVLSRRSATGSAGQITERVSRISLVDLAGSERADATMATGVRLKEGAKINQSLAVLGKVISALADREKKPHADSTKTATRESFVPYRDSVLTWLLKDSLGGNSRTFMIAAVSPADYAETLSTLRYADRAKRIVNQATVNEDATIRLVSDLKAEVAQLRRRLAQEETSKDLEDQLAASEKLVVELNTTWEEKLYRTQKIQAERERALAALGIAVDTNREGHGVGLHAPRDIPHLVNLSEDPLMSECLVYNLKPGRTLVGAGDDVDIRLGASGGVAPLHCYFEYNAASSTVLLHPRDECLVMVNGQQVRQPKELKSGYRMIIGSSFVFRLNHPQQVRQDRLRAADSSQAEEYIDDNADWQYAWNEAHPDSTPNPGPYYSPSNWSDSQSEMSDVPDNTSSTAYSALASSHHYAHLHAPEGNLRRPSSQASVRRAISISTGAPQRQRRSSVATDITALQSSSFDSRQRPRGQTISGLNISGARPPRRLGPYVSPVESSIAAEARERQMWERRLARLVLAQWRRHKLVKVGETMLRNAVYLKEANVIGKELGQKVVYQFAILRGGADVYPASPLEPDALPALLSDWDTINMPSDNDTAGGGKGSTWQTKSLGHPLLDSSDGTVPEVVVKVLDIGHTCWYVWSLAMFHAQLAKMRGLSTVKGSYRAHLVLDPFHATPAPRYSCIGSATYPIWPGDRPYSAKIDAPVIDSLSGLERGRMQGSLAALPIRQSNRAGSARAWNVIVHVKSLNGVSESEMTAVHCRLRLTRMRGLLPTTPTAIDDTSLVGQPNSGQPSAPNSPVMVSVSADQAARHNSPLAGFGNGPVNVQFRQQWTIDMLTVDTCVVIEFFGIAQPLALRRAFHEDVQIEQALQLGVPLQLGGNGGSSGIKLGCEAESAMSASQNLLVERLHEEELFVDSQHELAVWVRVLELGLDGQWERAPCSAAGLTSSAAFLMRQGLQRRVEVVVGHNASKHLHVSKVIGLRIGCPVLVDEKGRLVGGSNGISSSSSIGGQGGRMMADLPITRALLAGDSDAGGSRLDNRCFVQVAASWDTSVFGSRLLDMPTGKGMRVKMSLELALEIDNGAGPLSLITDIFVQIHSRQAAVAGRGWLASIAESAGGLFRPSSGNGNGNSNNISISSGAGSIYGAGSIMRTRSSISILDMMRASSDAISSSSSNTDSPPLSDPMFRVFSVTLSPTETVRGKGNLWRLNTAKKYVRGEETLLPWQPRSVRFVDEYHRQEHEDAWRLSVARTREHLEALGPLASQPADKAAVQRSLDHSFPSESQPPLSTRQQRILDIVYEAVRRISEFRRIPESSLGLQQEPLQDSVHTDRGGGEINSSSDHMDPDKLRKQVVRRLPCNILPISMQGHFCHRGWVDILDTNAAPDTWTKRWFVVERPYIFVFVDKDCRFLDNVINIASARVSVDPHVSEMLGRPNVLALYTNTNAYLLSPPADDVQKWISAIDEWYFMLI